MTTIDNLDIRIYFEYARRTEFFEKVTQQYGLDQAGTIPPQTHVADVLPHLSELDLLFGTFSLHPPWAYFYAPKDFDSQRRSAFGFLQIAPGLGSVEKQQADIAKLESIPARSEKRKKEKKKLKRLFDQMEEINDLIAFIIGRIGQFLQG